MAILYPLIGEVAMESGIRKSCLSEAQNIEFHMERMDW